MIHVNEDNVKVHGDVEVVLAEVTLALRYIKEQYELEDEDIEKVKKAAIMSFDDLEMNAIKNMENFIVSTFIDFMETEENCDSCDICDECEMFNLYNLLKKGKAGAIDILNLKNNENSQKSKKKSSGDLFDDLFGDLL